MASLARLVSSAVLLLLCEKAAERLHSRLGIEMLAEPPFALALGHRDRCGRSIT